MWFCRVLFCFVYINNPPSYQRFRNIIPFFFTALQWRHNGRDCVSSHQSHHCLLNRLFRRRLKKNQSSASQAFVPGIHRWPVNSPHKWPLARKLFPFDDVIMGIGIVTSLPSTRVWGMDTIGRYQCKVKHNNVFCTEKRHSRRPISRGYHNHDRLSRLTLFEKYDCGIYHLIRLLLYLHYNGTAKVFRSLLHED